MHRNMVGRPMEILLVEDSLTAATLAIGALRKAAVEHRLTLVTDGVEALEFLRRERKFAHAPRPDLVLLDLGLPKKDGREVLAEIRADDNLRDIPVVVMTGSTDPEDQRQTEDLQVESFLTKPVDFPKFLKVVSDLKRFWHADMILPELGK